MKSQFALLGSRRFCPLFVTQFLGAFHDNLFKNALAVLLLYGATGFDKKESALLVTLAGALFILPFILFSAAGGVLADKFPKDIVIRWIKLAEILIALCGMIALLTGSIILCFTVLFLLGVQSAVFGPSKYAILPDHLGKRDLIGGNALANSGTFLAILIGSIAGTVLMGLQHGALVTSFSLLFCALIGYAASRYIPGAPSGAPGLLLKQNPFAQISESLQLGLSQKPRVISAIVGVAWFYFMGSMFLAQFANYTKGTLMGDEQVLSLFLIVFSVGIACGGLLNNRLLKGEIRAFHVPYAVAGLSLFAADLYFASPLQERTELLHLSAFLQQPLHWRIMLDVWMVALCGGLFVVPLNTIIQHDTKTGERARIVAAGAILNALFMLVSAGLCMILIISGWQIRHIFLVFSILNILAALLLVKNLPASAKRSIERN